MAGSCFALWINAVDPENAASLWVLPFSAGGFLNIALVSVLPEIIAEKDPKENLYNFACMIAGVSVMSAVCLL